MSLVQRLGVATFVVVITGVGLSPAVEAHSANHHHPRKNKKKKAYNRGYKHGYRRAIENSYRPYYRTYAPVYAPLRRRYAPLRRRVVVAPAPWLAPVRPYNYGTRVNVGLGFNL